MIDKASIISELEDPFRNDTKQKTKKDFADTWIDAITKMGTEKHINPGTDTTINPVVIDDSYREKKQSNEVQHIYLDSAKPEDFMTANIGDWIQYVGDITTEYELKFVRNFGSFLCASHTTTPHPAPALDELKRDLEFKQACIENQAMHINTLNAKMVEMMQGAARKAREDFVKELISWIDQEIRDHPDDEAWYDSTLENVKDHINESLRHPTPPHTEQEQPR